MKILLAESATNPVTQIVGLNGLVFLAWQNQSWSSIMRKYFIHDPRLGTRPYTMLTSTFSHYSLLHIFFNMSAFTSLAPVTNRIFNDKYEFTAFYLTSGMFASLISHISAQFRKPYMRSPSLGASGAVLSMASVSAVMYPDLPMGIMFLPFHFRISELLTGFVVLDIIGLIRGWRTVDHAAHLGGVLFGWLYVKYGRDYWDRMQRKRLD